MAINLDKIVVVDIESTCWENGKAPEGQISEIIEVGICLLDVHTEDIPDILGFLKDGIVYLLDKVHYKDFDTNNPQDTKSLGDENYFRSLLNPIA